MSKTPSAVHKSEGGTLDKAIEEMRSALHEEAQPNMDAEKTGFLVDIPVELQIVLGSAEMTVSELMALQRGSTVSLDRRIGEPVEIMVNGRLIARGEITILENDPSRFGVRLTEIGGSIKAE